jgi:hypothetical protein
MPLLNVLKGQALRDSARGMPGRAEGEEKTTRKRRKKRKEAEYENDE